MKLTVILLVSGALRTILKGLVKEDLKIRETVATIQTIVEIGQNTEKSRGDLKRLAVTQTPEKNYQLTLVWKTPIGIK